MHQLHHFIKHDKCSHNRAGRFKTKKEAMAVGNDLGLVPWQHQDGSWDLE